MAALHPSTSDEQYFRDRIEENVRRIEQCFLRVRNDCFQRLSVVHEGLPDEITKSIPALSNYSSFVQYQKDDPSIKQRIARDRASKYDKYLIQPLQMSRSMGSNTSTKTTPTSSKSDTFTTKEKHVKPKKSQSTSASEFQDQFEAFESSSLGNENGDGDGDGDNKIDFDDHNVAKSKEDSFDFGIGDDEDEQKREEIVVPSDDDLSEYLGSDTSGNPIRPPSQLYVDREVFSHLPPAAHREIISILRTLGQLKLFAWQNGEGLRKIIKKYDKQFDVKMTEGLWPKIKMNEFMQEPKHTGYITEICAILCTRIIPFGYFNATELRERGVNLNQMLLGIKELGDTKVTAVREKQKIPMNVEPRSYMANERTFLKWIRLAGLVSISSLLLYGINFERVSSIVLLIASVAIVLRAYHQYYNRNEVFINRIEWNWIDSLGPKILTLSLLLTLILYLVYMVMFDAHISVLHK